MESSKDFDKHVIIMIGLSGSGKTTYSDQLKSENSESVAVIERDRIRHEMQRERDVEGYDESAVNWKRWNWDWERSVTDIQYKTISDALKNEQITTVILSDTNLTPRIRKLLIDHVEKTSEELDIVSQIDFKFIDISLNDCIVRDKKRKYPVGEEVINKQYRKLEPQLEFLRRISI